MVQSNDSTDLPLHYKVLFSIVSLTWLVADSVKPKGSGTEDARARIIQRLNSFWLSLATISFAATWFFSGNRVSAVQFPAPVTYNLSFAFLWRAVWSYLLWARCTEIFIAFFKDAFDKIGEPIANSSLKPKDRLRLAFKSYLELIINFSLLFALCPHTMWLVGPIPSAPSSISDVLYFSATTITTSGNGEMIPVGKLLQLLSTYEIFCGLILLVVCFTIYTGLKRTDQ